MNILYWIASNPELDLTERYAAARKMQELRKELRA